MARTLRLSSSEGARSSLAKTLVLCLPTAFSEMNRRWAIAPLGPALSHQLQDLALAGR